jgi:hypothetical protein
MQDSRYKPFSILIISPDSASIDSSLINLIDTVEYAYRDIYYKAIREMEFWKTLEDEDQKRETELKIQRAKWMEMEIYDFKYFQTISIGSYVALLESFNKYPWEEKSLVCEIEETRWLYTRDMLKLAKYYAVDYIVSFKNIHTDRAGDKLTLKMTTVLYSEKQNGIIFEKEMSGTTDSNFGTWRCKNDLLCLLHNVTKSSTEEIEVVLAARQKK